MVDGVGYTPGVGLKIATRDVEYSGETMQVQAVGLVTFSGLDDAKVVADVGADNPLPVIIAANQPAVPVNQSGVSASGALTALNASLPLVLDGASGFAVDLRGTFVGTVTFQATIDGTNWFSIVTLPAASGVNVAAVSTATAPGAWVGPANGFLAVRAILTAYTSGSVTVTLRAIQGGGVVFSMPSGAAGGRQSSRALARG